MKNWSETGYICFSRSATRTFGTFQNIRTFQPENLIPFSISGNEILANFVDIYYGYLRIFDHWSL